MYCPECKQEFDGKFCPECGAKLIENPPQASGININLGDANAISGGINLHDSHDVHHTDNSVHNITTNNSTINNITNVAAQKSEVEILQERSVEFLNLVNSLLNNGPLDAEGLRALDQERMRIGLDPVTANKIINQAKKNTVPAVHNLSPVQQLILKQVKEAIASNNKEQLLRQLPRLESLSKNTEDDEAQYLYSLVSAALHPRNLIQNFEESAIDNYWNSFWVYIAYSKIGDAHKAESVLFNLSHFTQYPEENLIILSGVEAYRALDKEAAKDILSSINGSYSPYLNDFVSALYFQVDPEFAELLINKESQLEFYLTHLLDFVDEHTQREIEEAEASRLFNLSLDHPGSNAFKVTMLLRSGLNLSLAESKAILECCPIHIVKSKPMKEIEELASKLKEAGAEVSLIEMSK